MESQPVNLCMCGDRQADQCPGEWESGCDLGANELHVTVHEPSEQLKEAVDQAPDLRYAGNQRFDEWRGF
jgi:hypothetical protein